MLRGKIFTDDEDDTKSYYVADVKYFKGYRQMCCLCVPFKDNLNDAKVLAEEAKRKQEDDHDEGLIFDCDFVHLRVDTYEGGSCSDFTAEKPTCESRVITTKSTTAANKRKSKEIPTANQFNLLNKFFTNVEKKKRITYFVADVKFMEDFGGVCCCCVVHNGDVKTTKQLAEQARRTNTYEDDYVFDCGYVKRRVDVYSGR